MTFEFGEDTPSPTCSLQSAKCSWHYGSHRCELRAGHDILGIPHQVVLRFDASTASKADDPEAIGYGLPKPPAEPPRCDYCEHSLTTGCEVWSEKRDAGICRCFSIKR